MLMGTIESLTIPSPSYMCIGAVEKSSKDARMLAGMQR